MLPSDGGSGALFAFASLGEGGGVAVNDPTIALR
ncbi:MAG: hypothetical protein LASZOEIN_001814, partial [Candidatus Fervidibacter sp.]